MILYQALLLIKELIMEEIIRKTSFVRLHASANLSALTNCLFDDHLQEGTDLNSIHVSQESRRLNEISEAFTPHPVISFLSLASMRSRRFFTPATVIPYCPVNSESVNPSMNRRWTSCSPAKVSRPIAFTR